jgi:hypothetical protein
MKSAFIMAGLSLAQGWLSGAGSPFSLDSNKNVWGKAKRSLKSMKSRFQPSRGEDWAKSQIDPVTGQAFGSYAEAYQSSSNGNFITADGRSINIPKTAAGWARNNPIPSDAYLPQTAPNLRGGVPARLAARNDFNRRTGWGPLNKPRWQGKAQGGHSPDDIAALLMGGEYVMNKDTVNRHGVDFFDRLNRGELPTFAEGGLVGEESLLGTERAGKGGGLTNNINITVNVSKDGESVVSVSSEGAEQEQGKALADQIRKQVINTIIEQKRQGGILSPAFNKTQTAG